VCFADLSLLVDHVRFTGSGITATVVSGSMQISGSAVPGDSLNRAGNTYATPELYDMKRIVRFSTRILGNTVTGNGVTPALQFCDR
jgi:hypothetical protein